MERILVCMDGVHGAWEALSRSIALAGRIDARISVLRVVPPHAPGAARAGKAEAGDAVRGRLELIIEAAKARGVRIEHFVAEGSFEEEVIRFVEQDRTTLLVVEAAEGEGRSQDPEAVWLQTVRHRVSCRVEMVSPKKNANLQTNKG